MGVVEVSVDRVGGFVHRARWQDFTFFSDTLTWPTASPILPTPLAFFAASIGFCATTQVEIFGRQLKVPIDAITTHVGCGWSVTEQVPTLDIAIDVTSERGPAEVAAVLSNAHAGCYAERALSARLKPALTVIANGEKVAVELPAAIAFDPDQDDHSATIDIRNLSGPAHLATWQQHTFASDEPPRLGGADQYPIPIAYFVGAVGMSILSELEARSAAMGLDDVAPRSRTTSYFSRSGSVLAGTVESTLDGFDIDLDLDLPGASDHIVALTEHSLAHSWPVRALIDPVRVSSTSTHNGQELDVSAYPRRLNR